MFSIKAALVSVEVCYSYIIYGCELREFRVWLLVDLVISLDVTFDHPSKDAF